jgi:hypothetical protein
MEEICDGCGESVPKELISGEFRIGYEGATAMKLLQKCKAEDNTTTRELRFDEIAARNEISTEME